jgi:hypothetical protein
MKSIQELSESELTLVCDAQILYLKNAALQKIKLHLQNFQDQLQQSTHLQQLEQSFNSTFRSAKISKGENYRALPYLILDYPAQFSKSSIFAFRTLFWWGNFFSFTLHLQGEALELVRKSLIAHSTLIQQSEYYICIHENPWEYHFEPNNYKKASAVDANELKLLFSKKDFVKLSFKLDIKDYKNLEAKGLQLFNELITYLGNEAN